MEVWRLCVKTCLRYVMQEPVSRVPLSHVLVDREKVGTGKQGGGRGQKWERRETEMERGAVRGRNRRTNKGEK